MKDLARKIISATYGMMGADWEDATSLLIELHSRVIAGQEDETRTQSEIQAILECEIQDLLS